MKKALLFLFAITLFSCAEEKIETITSNASLDEIVKNGYKCGKGATLTQYTFKNKTVYAYAPGSCCCDFATDIYNDKYEKICLLGGFGGLTDCEGVNFYESAKKVKEIWHE